MEPAREERDDLSAFTGIIAQLSPQWSPLVKSGMTTRVNPQEGTTKWVPQWSPLVKSGMTYVSRVRVLGQGGRNGARS